MNYVLEHAKESERLEFQAKLSNYSLNDELEDLRIETGKKVLDAGCGSGLLSRFLKDRFEGVSVHACDLSAVRLQQAKQLASAPPYDTIRFFSSSLYDVAAESNSFDLVICRFVFEHLEDPLKAAKEFYRILKAGAKVCLIDLDGILFNLHTSNPTLERLSDELRRGWKTDLFVGRKLPNILKTAGFGKISWKIQTMQFQGAELINELELTKQRLAFIRPTLLDILGTEEKVNQYNELYCKEMMSVGSTLFYNKFIVFAEKEDHSRL